MMAGPRQTVTQGRRLLNIGLVRLASLAAVPGAKNDIAI
jgi:hypothetical protein